MEIPDLPADGLEWRRFRAVHLKEQGWSRQDIAEALGVSPVSVSRWFARVRDGGPEARRTHPSPGHPPKLSPAGKGGRNVRRVAGEYCGTEPLK